MKRNLSICVTIVALVIAGLWFVLFEKNTVQTEELANIPAQTKPPSPLVAKPDQQEGCNTLPTPVERLACRVDQSAIILVIALEKNSNEYIQRKLINSDQYRLKKDYKKYSAIKAMEYIQTNVSSARYLFNTHRQKANFSIPKDANEALELGIGICGNQIAVFLAVMDELSIKARSIQFWYEYKHGTRYSHIGAEVYYGGGWHYFDITWNSYFTEQQNQNILSIDDVLSNEQRQLHINNNNVWFQYSKSVIGLDGIFSYLNSNADITRDEVGVVRAYSLHDGNGSYTLPLLHIPNYVGDNKQDGKQRGISYSFDVPAGSYKVDIALLAKAGCLDSSLYINDNKVAFNDRRAKFVVNNPKTAEVRGTSDVCYFVLKNIEMNKIESPLPAPISSL